MKLLFILTNNADQEVLGMAQLSAAFGQEVSIIWPVAPSSSQLAACKEAGISACCEITDRKQVQAYLSQADRVVRL